jgi:EAL domain-containing protein (putative c-di-GMP-specific phosphodiesterase class I)
MAAIASSLHEAARQTLGTITEAQGYLFSRPVPESTVRGLLGQNFNVQY